jgi:diguanylate cyclase (GGDEF)-like protein
VPKPKTIQILVVEDCLDDQQLLRDALNEIVEAPHWPNWHSCEVVPAESVSEAVDFIDSFVFDAILLNLSLPDSRTLVEAFSRVHDAAGPIPIIILADQEDEPLAHLLLRDGAQDVLLKPGLECLELAKSLRYAIERQRRVRATESTTFFDPFTGLFNERGFTAFVDRDIHLARRKGDSVTVAIIEVDGLSDISGPGSRETRDLVLLRAGELLRNCFDEGAVVARIGESEFGVCTSTVSENGAEYRLDGFERSLRALHAALSVRVGAATCGAGHLGGLSEILAESRSRLASKDAILAH